MADLFQFFILMISINQKQLLITQKFNNCWNNLLMRKNCNEYDK